MINYITKDITSVERGIVAHGCNAQGKMGAGVALAIRKKWPRAYQDYKIYCDSFIDKKSILGNVQFVSLEKEGKLIIANCFTQQFYGRNGVYASVQAIKRCLESVAAMAHGNDLSIYMPKIGCGLGGLNWDKDIQPIVENIAADYQVDINVLDIKQK